MPCIGPSSTPLPWLRPSFSSVHPLSSFSLSLYHPHLSAQKVSKCQMGVVIVFNGIIFLHRNTVCLCVCACAPVCVRVSWRNTIEKNEIEQDIENGKLLLSTKGGLTHSCRKTWCRAGDVQYILQPAQSLLCLAIYFPSWLPPCFHHKGTTKLHWAT